ncbi:transcription factor EGL1-like [Musa acuminata AAA Group]|uniref:transcription factor EGL1-like n=1 Tax=Musa acuminata AAA Group TaxID=214697 RepID=UPI0031DA6402
MCRAMDVGTIHEALSPKHLRKQLAATVREIQWSYAIFWSPSTGQPGVLAWSDGYYNGDIKTRKMTQPMELKADQMGLQRSKQLRELYGSLSAGDNNQQTRRPSASLSPEDLTDAEWYYLVCMTFTFTPGQGLPGKAFATNQHIWLNNAQFADSKIFSRSLLAKSASIQTLVCIPFAGGVLELGTTEKVLEDPALIKQISSFFREMPNPVGSEKSASSPQMTENDEDILCPSLDNDVDSSMALEEHDLMSGRQAASENDPTHLPFGLGSYAAAAEHAQPVQDKVEEPEIVSPDDSSNVYCLNQPREDSFGTDGLTGISRTQNPWLGALNSNECLPMPCVGAQRVVTSAKKEIVSNQMLDGIEEGNCSKHNSLEIDGDGSRYAKTVAVILRNSKPVLFFLTISRESSFVVWRRGLSTPKPFTGTPQTLLKKILMDRRWLHGGHMEKAWRPEGESGGSYLLSEMRREKLNEKFVVLRSLIPSISKVDKASILDDTTRYLKQLERRVQELESCRETAELSDRDRRKQHPDVSERTSDNYIHREITDGRKASANKRKARDMDEAEAEHEHHCVEVSVTMKEKEVVVKMHCPWREYLLPEIVESMSNLHLDPLSVQSSTVDGMLAMTVKSKLRSTTVASPVMIKRSLQRVIGKCL